MRLAYLCNVYPAVSHSFVRREIEGLEAAGHDVRRFSLRPASEDLRDAADFREARLTEAVLRGGLFPLALAAMILALTRPHKTIASIRAAGRLSGPGLTRKLKHIAYWLEAAWLVRKLNQYRIEHLHAHFGTNPAAVAAIATAWGGPSFSFTVHGPDEFDAPIELGLSEKIKRSVFVAAISNYGRAQLMRWTDPKQWDKIRIVRCGLDRSFLSAEPRAVDHQSRKLITVARLSAQKGLTLLIDASAQLQKSNADFTMVIIGDGELRAQIESEIADRGLHGVVHLLGSRSAEEIRHHLLDARAFVLPSFAEGLPVVLMEALAMARPVIATAIAGVPELVDDQCGWLIAAGSQEALISAMKAALQATPDELNAMAEIGRARVHSLHDAKTNAEALAAIIEEVRSITCTQ